MSREITMMENGSRSQIHIVMFPWLALGHISPYLQENGSRSQIHIVMFPWLALGHISPYLQLSNSLANRGFNVSLVSTHLNVSKIPNSALAKSVKLVALPFPRIEGLPAGIENTADLPTELMPLFLKAADGLEQPFQQLLSQLQPHCVLFDFFQWWTPRAVAAAQLSIPTIFFHTCGAAFSSYAIHPVRRGGEKEITVHDLTKPPPDYPSSVISWKVFEAETVMGSYKVPQGEPGAISFVERGLRCYEYCSAMAIKTCNEMEGCFVEYLQNKVVGKPVLPVGPLLPPLLQQSKTSESMCLTWLGKQAPCSVVYVAFGSQCFLSREETTEIALGLEASQQPFLWALRLSPGTLITDVLPQGFEEHVEGRGVVVREWAPQREILCHPCTGAFMTHCGWNSVMEGLSSGLPLVASPMNLDQALNARLVCGQLQVGVEVGRREEDSRLRREEICRAVKTVMVEEEGKQLRINAGRMGDIFNEGIPFEELYLNEFVSHLQRLCL